MSIQINLLEQMDLLPQLDKFDKYKRGDVVYTISHSTVKICGNNVSFPIRVNKMCINKIAYSLADDAEAFKYNYNSVNLYLYLDLIAMDDSCATNFFNSNSSDNWLETPKETIVVELFYHILPDSYHDIPIFDSSHFQNELLDENKLSVIRQIKDSTKSDSVWLTEDEAVEETRRQSNAAAKAMIELLDIGAKYIKQSERNLKNMTVEHMEGTEFLKNFIKSKCSPDFEVTTRYANEWLELSLKGLLYAESERSDCI